MAEKFQYTLEYNSIATGTGAAETARDLVRLTDATHSATEKAHVSRWGFYDLDAELKKTNSGTETLNAGLTKLAPTTRNNAQALLMFSQGFEDAQYGIRGVLNNIPSLIFAMGGTAGLAGAISIAAVAGSQLYSMLSKTEEKSSEVEDRLNSVASAMRDVETDRFEAMADGIDSARDAAEALKATFDETRTSEASLAASALDNAAKIAAAQANIVRMLGLQVDQHKELEAIAAAEEEKRKLAAEQAIAAENNKLEKAKETVTAAADYLTAKTNQAAIEEANLIRLRAQLTTLREQRAELEQLAQQRTVMTDDPGRQLLGAVFPKTLPLSESAKDARKQLADPYQQAAIKAVEERVNALDELVRNLTDENKGAIIKAENALNAARSKAEDLSTAVSANIERIEETLVADDLLARSELVVTTAEQTAADIQDAISKIETTTAAGDAAKQTLTAAAADGKITADESRAVADSLRSIIGQVQAGVTTTSGNVQELLALIRSVSSQAARDSRDIQTLKTQVGQLFNRIK